jgi:hypothetical protein
MVRRFVCVLAVSAAAVTMTTPVRALINPKFTPVHLVEQSETILALKMSAPDGKQVIRAKVTKRLKGGAADEEVLIDLSTAARPDWAKKIGAVAAARGDAPAMFFAGTYREEDGGDNNGDAVAFLQLDRDWVRLARGQGRTWEMLAVDAAMQGTWDGGSDTLFKVVEYVLEDPGSADVPVAVGVNWAERKDLGRVTGRVGMAQAVDLAGDGTFVLFVASTAGDRFFAWDAAAKDFRDVTAAKKAASKSVRAAWADFDGDGKVDLASWDGERLTLWRQSADGTFGAQGVEVREEFGGGIAGLAVVDSGTPGRAALVVAASRGVALVALGKGEEPVRATWLDLGTTDVKPLGAPAGCVAADLNQDGWPEIMEVFAKGALVYVGKAGGGFEPARITNVAAGAAPAAVSLGDYDMDGLLDFLIAGRDGCRLWANQGQLRFVETFEHTGEFFTTAGPGAVAAQVCDINNDGRQDAALFYAEGIPLIFFNRGFRSFGKSLSLTESGLVEGIADTKDGQQAGVVEDLNGDGAQDMALVLKNGGVMVFLRKTFEGEAPLSVRVFLPPGGCVGPVTVVGREGRRSLGAWNVVAGSSEAFLATQSAGEVRLTWTLPGGRPQEKKVVLETRPARVRLQ